MYEGLNEPSQLKGDKESTNEALVMNSGIAFARRGLRSRFETKSKLDELKKQMEMDFDSKYITFKSIDQGVRNSEIKYKNLMHVQPQTILKSTFRVNISDQFVQQTLDHYTKIYSIAEKKPVKTYNNMAKGYVVQVPIPDDISKPKTRENECKSSYQKSNTTNRMKAIVSYNRMTSANSGSGVDKTFYAKRRDKSNLLSFI